MTDRELMQQAIEALEAMQSYAAAERKGLRICDETITALRAALAETGSCIACGNRMTGSPESFVVATAEVGATAPESYSPQQVEALHPYKGGDKTSPTFAEPEQKPVAWLYPEGFAALKAGKCWTAYGTKQDDNNIPIYDAVAPRVEPRASESGAGFESLPASPDKQPEQEPFGYFQYSMHLDAWVQNKEERKGIAFYTTPPQRKPLTDETGENK